MNKYLSWDGGSWWGAMRMKCMGVYELVCGEAAETRFDLSFLYSKYYFPFFTKIQITGGSWTGEWCLFSGDALEDEKTTWQSGGPQMRWLQSGRKVEGFGKHGVGGVLKMEDPVSRGAMGGSWGMGVRWNFVGGEEIMNSVYDEAYGLKAFVWESPKHRLALKMLYCWLSRWRMGLQAEECR